MPLQLDGITLFSTTLVIGSVASAAMMFVSYAHWREPAARLWALGFLLNVLSAAIYARADDIPLALSIVLINGSGIIGTAALYLGVLRFFAVQPRWRLLIILYLFAAILITQATLLYPSYAMRNAAYSVAVGVTLLMLASELLEQARGKQRAACYMVAACLLVYIIAIIARAISLFALEETERSYSPTLARTAWLVLTNITIYITAFGFLLMVSVRLAERLKAAANCDDLTGALTRSSFFYKIRTRAKNHYGGHYAFILFNIDFFKRVNEELGQAYGDHVLTHFAKLAERAMPENGLFVRAGGDEFWLAFPCSEEALALGVANKIRDSLVADPLLFDGQVYTVSVSAGVCIAPFEELRRNFEHVVSLAEKALVKAKHSGRNQSCLSLFGDDWQLE